MICVKCGYSNDEKDSCCAKCGGRLPKVYGALSGDAAGTVPKVNDRLQTIEEAVNKVKEGRMDAQAFAAFVKETSEILQEKEAGIRSIVIPKEAEDDFKEELTVGFHGIKLYCQGMNELALYVSDNQNEHLDKGLALVRDGNECINDAMRINRENRAKLEESDPERGRGVL